MSSKTFDLAPVLKAARLLGLSLLFLALSGAVHAQSYTLITEPDDGKGQILNLINSAQSTITLTIYELEDSDIIGALCNASQRGVNVRVIYNDNSFRGHDPNDPYLPQLKQAGVDAHPAWDQYTVTHQKTLTIDGKTAAIMTFNLVPNYFTSTRDFGIITTDPGQVAEIASVFEADWNQETIYPTQPDLVWSPTNSRQKIESVIDGARSTLDVYNEEDSDPESMQDLEAAAQQRGVKVRFITAALSGKDGVDGNAAGRATLNADGVDARVLNAPNYIHAKMVLADYGTPNALAYIGSENFSKTSLDKNRELGILLHADQTSILGSLETTFNGDWSLTQPDTDAPPVPAEKPTRHRKPRYDPTASVNASAAQAADSVRASIKPAEFYPEP